MNQRGLEMVLYVIGGTGLAFVLHFLWNLWLAPYRILEERLDNKLSVTEKSTSSNSPKEPQPANAALYQNHKTLSLYEAACLWVEIEPHYPIVDQRAGAKLSCLKGAVRNGELVCAWRSSWTHIVDTVQGIRDKTPTDSQEVAMVALRRYAEKIGSIPLFLRHVSLPLESSKKEGAEKQSTPSTDRNST